MRTERGFDRLVNFSDAVVAIAITLLVLPLVDIPGELRSSSVSAMFVEYQWSFFGFGLSLSVIARFWQAHHQLFEYLGDYSSRLLWVDTVWLLSIVALPFSTALLASRADVDNARAVKGVYLGTIVATSALLAWMLLIIQRSPELQRGTDEGVDGEQDGQSTRAAQTSLLDRNVVQVFVPTGVFVVATVMAVSVPKIGMWATLLAFFTGPLGEATARFGSAPRSHTKALPPAA